VVKQALAKRRMFQLVASRLRDAKDVEEKKGCGQRTRTRATTARIKAPVGAIQVEVSWQMHACTLVGCQRKRKGNNPTLIY
jgi:hypothetical protein